MTGGVPRELTRVEKVTIRRITISDCANYDREYGCLPLDCDCVMLHKCWTGAYCKYFRRALLPVDTILEAALTGGIVETRRCDFCGGAFPAIGRRAYCSDVCKGKAQRRQQREHMRKKRCRC
jgi:predicted nucleic acid binding AN1-type Zn finger protein